eukprot:PhF_6_TR31891/c0_g1_i1/m.47432
MNFQSSTFSKEEPSLSFHHPSRVESISAGHDDILRCMLAATRVLNTIEDGGPTVSRTLTGSAFCNANTCEEDTLEKHVLEEMENIIRFIHTPQNRRAECPNLIQFLSEL